MPGFIFSSDWSSSVESATEDVVWSMVVGEAEEMVVESYTQRWQE